MKKTKAYTLTQIKAALLKFRNAEKKRVKALHDPSDAEACIQCAVRIAKEISKFLVLVGMIAIAAPEAPQAVPGQFIVKLKADKKGFVAPSIGRGFLLSKRLGLAISEIPEAMVGTLSKDVEYIEPNYIYTMFGEPNDPMRADLWGMRAIEAWDSVTESKVLTAVIDTGADYNHPDLKASMFSKGYNAITDTMDAMDDQGHGTHVSGTIAGVGNNGIGIAGVLWKGALLPVKFLDNQGAGSLAGAIRALEHAMQRGAKIYSNSWGGGGRSKALEDVISEICKTGGIFVAAAGNGGMDQKGDNNDTSPQYPASYPLPCVIGVAATDSAGKLAEFSNYGKTVHVAAPGVNILSTLPGNTYRAYSGTSMATPHVSGVVAAILTKKPSLTAEQIKDALMKTATPVKIECPWYKKWFARCKVLGSGQINMKKALEVL